MSIVQTVGEALYTWPVKICQGICPESEYICIFGKLKMFRSIGGPDGLGHIMDIHGMFWSSFWLFLRLQFCKNSLSIDVCHHERWFLRESK